MLIHLICNSVANVSVILPELYHAKTSQIGQTNVNTEISCYSSLANLTDLTHKIPCESLCNHFPSAASEVQAGMT